MRIKPSIFIASSSKFLEVAHQLKAALEEKIDVRVTTWDDPLGVFRLGRSTMDSILTAPHFFDYSIAIMSPDDWVVSKGRRSASPRDNVVFELGFFLGSQGRLRAFAVVLEPHCPPGKRSASIKIPTDCAGEQFLPVRLTAANKAVKKDIAAAIAKLASTIENQRNLSFLTPLPSTILAAGYYRNFLRPMCDTLVKSNRIKVGKESFSLKNEGFLVTVAIPSKLEKGSRSGQYEFKRKHSLEDFTIGTEIRPFPFFVSLKRTKKGFQFFDVPTTLAGCSEAIRLLMPDVGAVGRSKERELAENRETENFAETLEHLIESDLEGQHLTPYLRVNYW